MEFRQFPPADVLKPYIKCFYIFQSANGYDFNDIVFPSGSMEVVFNLGEGTWESLVENKFRVTPPVELWGQITKPLAIKSRGTHSMLGIKFLPHSAGFFLNDEIGAFNNRVFDLCDILGHAVKILHAQLLETAETSKRITLVENFLIRRLARTEKLSCRINKVANILIGIKNNSEENNICHIASTHGITPRYLHKLIYQHTGLSPKSFTKITRFQKSLKLIGKNERPLTSIAYDCGYFDQSHFIRDFKSFTSVTPSAYLEKTFPVNQVFLQ
jgi:AraC-like DNA-binding protein